MNDETGAVTQRRRGTEGACEQSTPRHLTSQPYVTHSVRVTFIQSHRASHFIDVKTSAFSFYSFHVLTSWRFYGFFFYQNTLSE